MRTHSLVRRIRGAAVAWFMFFLCLAVVGGGCYLYLENQRKMREAAALRAEALKKQQEAARLAKLEAERMKREAAERARLAEAERLKREEEERARLAEAERLRRLAEEEARRKAAQNKDEPAPVVVDDTIKEDPRNKVFHEKLVLTGLSANNRANAELWDKMLKTLCTTNGWATFKQAIDESLKQELGRALSLDRFNMDTFYKNPYLRQAISLFNIINQIPDESLVALNGDGSGQIEDSFMYYLISNRDNSLLNLQRSLTSAEDPDELVRILTTWKELWEKSTPEFRTKYQSLAIACALVKPDKRERCQTIDASPMSMEEVYNAFCESAEQKQLKTDISSMPPTDLIYVVNIGLPLSEFKWAQQHVKLTRASWSRAYPMIRYRMDRATHGVNPYKKYTFEEILKEGGVCRDQGYFACNTARSNGIPACYVTGSGNLGPHAWFIYMGTPNSWTSAGGYGYLTGKTSNPQTGKQVHESLFNMRSDKKASGKKLEETQDMILMARMFKTMGQNTAARNLIEQATLNTPSHPLPWEATIELLQEDKEHTTPEQWEQLSNTLKKRFKNRPDFLSMAEEIDTEYVRDSKDGDEIAKDLVSERRALEKRKNGKVARADLAIQALKRQIDYLTENNQLDEVDKIYRKTIRDYAKQTDALKTIQKMYYGFASEHDAYLPKAIDAMERNYKSNVETSTTFYFTVKQEVDVIKQIAGYMRQVGNDKKADRIEKAANERFEASKKAADS